MIISRQIRERIGKHQADRRDHQAHPERAGEDIQVHRLIRRDRCQLAHVVDAVIEGSQQIVGCERTVVTTDDLPIGRVAPALIESLERFLIGRWQFLEWERAGRLGHQAAETGLLHVQAFGQIAQRLILPRLEQVFAEGPVHRFLR